MSETLKVITYNIHKGFNTGNMRFVLARIREMLEEEQADVVFLQEIHGHTERHQRKRRGFPDVPHFEYLADRLWPHYAYGKNAIYRSGHHGNAILSKYPFKFWENIDAARYSFTSRSILHGIIELPGRAQPLHTLCVHFGLRETARRKQLDLLIERIANHIPQDEPLIIAGDFNDWRSNAAKHFEEDLEVKELFEQLTGRHARTFPAWYPLLPMDRIYHRGVEPVACSCLSGRSWRALSDHAPLSGTYRLV